MSATSVSGGAIWWTLQGRGRYGVLCRKNNLCDPYLSAFSVSLPWRRYINPLTLTFTLFGTAQENLVTPDKWKGSIRQLQGWLNSAADIPGCELTAADSESEDGIGRCDPASSISPSLGNGSVSASEHLDVDRTPLCYAAIPAGTICRHLIETDRRCRLHHHPPPAPATGILCA